MQDALNQLSAPELLALAAALLGGTLAATSQAAKTSTRAAANAAPEPFSNLGLSLLEGGLVVGALWLATQHLVVFAVLLVMAVLAMWALTWLLFNFFRAAWRRAFPALPKES